MKLLLFLLQLLLDVLVLLLEVLGLLLELEDLVAHHLDGSGLHVEVALQGADVGFDGSPERRHLLAHCARHLI